MNTYKKRRSFLVSRTLQLGYVLSLFFMVMGCRKKDHTQAVQAEAVAYYEYQDEAFADYEELVDLLISSPEEFKNKIIKEEVLDKFHSTITKDKTTIQRILQQPIELLPRLLKALTKKEDLKDLSTEEIYKNLLLYSIFKIK